MTFCCLFFIFLMIPVYFVQIGSNGAAMPEERKGNSFNYTFNRSTTGVVFSPFVKHYEDGSIPTSDQYTLKEIKTMFEVVAHRFQMTATFGTGAGDGQYEKNVSYHHAPEKVVLCPEAASLVNRERNDTAVTVMIGIWLQKNTLQVRTEFELGFESAAIANANFPGTATGLILTHLGITGNPHEAKTTLNHLRLYKTRARGENLRMGSRQTCALLNDQEKNFVQEVAQILQDIIKESDFVICMLSLEDKNTSAGVEAVMVQVKQEVLGYKHAIGGINPNIEVMFETGWPGDSRGSSEWQTVSNLAQYWSLVDAWAHEKQIKVWMTEAFDVPLKNWKPELANYGWWKLQWNKDAGSITGYVEKIFAKPEEETTTNYNIWIYVGSVMGIALLVVLITVIIFLYLRVNKLKEILTKEDVREFMQGISCVEAAVVTSERGEIESAFMVPYNKDKFEISKENIVIQREHLLGSGQFGYVFKAIISVNPSEKTVVALKMTKPECPKAGIKSLLSEIKILTYLGKHPNIVSIVGAYTGEMEKGIVYVMMEICNMGSLEKFLRNEEHCDSKNKKTSRYKNLPSKASLLPIDGDESDDDNPHYMNLRQKITMLEMIKWSHEIACGMEYLETKNVIHADLATRNVLLTVDKVAKITDFGLSRRLYDYTNYVKQQQEPLPWRWMAIESLKKLEFSSMSDVWSYGVTIWEIFSCGDSPWPALNWNLGFVVELENGLRMLSPKYATPEIYQVMLDCWEDAPCDRPSFTELKQIMSQFLLITNSENDTYLK